MRLRDHGCEIRCVDAIEGLQSLPDNSIDLTITSPPYNIGKAYETTLPLEQYLGWCEKWIREIYRVTKTSGCFWLNVGYLRIPTRGDAVPIAYLLWDRIPF